MTMQIKEYSRLSAEVLGEGLYRERCTLGNLTPFTAGYGLFLCEDEQGRRISAITMDLDYHRDLAARPGAVFDDLSQEKLYCSLPGWPEDWEPRGAYHRGNHHRRRRGARSRTA